MLDIQKIRENPQAIKDAAQAKGFSADAVDHVLALDGKRRGLIQEIDAIRAQKNKLTKENVEEGKALKIALKEKEETLRQTEESYAQAMLQIPNPSAPDVIVGAPDKNQIVKTVGTVPSFPFPVKDHVDIGTKTNTIDIERGTKVAQSGFYYMKGAGALLELALVSFAMEKLAKLGFVPVITPNAAKERNVVGCGFQPRSDKERQIYHIQDEDLDLIATAEITLVGQHTDEVLDEKNLPLSYAGFSSCYRTEAGSYGKDVRGILRVHEFRKVEMVVFCAPEESDAWHDKLLAIEEGIWQDLGIPYQVVKMATGDLGSAATRKYDIEAWMPSQNKYREVTSTSNTTDFQARRLNIKMKRHDGNQYVHTLNGTVLALGRAIIAIYENYQQADGSVKIPDALVPYMHGVTAIK